MTTQEIALEILVALIRAGHTARDVDEAVRYSVTGAKLLRELTKEEGETK